MKNLCLFLAALLAFALSPAIVAQEKPASESHVSQRVKTVFSAADALAQVHWNAHFGYKQANRAAFTELKTYVALLNEPKLLDKVNESEKECVTKGCKSTIPPLKNAEKEWNNASKRWDKESAYALMMGGAAGTVDFYYHNAPKLTPMLRDWVAGDANEGTTNAAAACELVPGCPKAVADAFDELTIRLRTGTFNAEHAEAMLKIIREQMRLGNGQTQGN